MLKDNSKLTYKKNEFISLLNGIDDKGLFLDCTGKFSGLLLSAKIEGKVGWFKHTIEFKSDPVLKSDDIPLDKFYFNNE